MANERAKRRRGTPVSPPISRGRGFAVGESTTHRREVSGSFPKASDFRFRARRHRLDAQRVKAGRVSVVAIARRYVELPLVQVAADVDVAQPPGHRWTIGKRDDRPAFV